MNYKKGQMVSVKDCDGRRVALRVWRDDGAVVLVASDEVFRLLETGKTELWPIGVPKADVSVVRRSATKG
jgi:hypothetical protein